MIESFRIRIGSRSARVSTKFAFNILPCLQFAICRVLSPIQITLKQHDNACPFSDVQGWDWPSSIERLRKLAQDGLNAFILADEFLDWKTPADAINDDLYRFEDELAALGITVFSVESYSEQEQTEMPELFSSVSNWHAATLSEIVAEMTDGFRTETLCFPYGILPYILIDPQEKLSGQNQRHHVHALVGFQPWQYERILGRWSTPEFPMKHALGKINGKPIPQTGAIPMDIDMNQTAEQDESSIR